MDVMDIIDYIYPDSKLAQRTEFKHEFTFYAYNLIPDDVCSPKVIFLSISKAFCGAFCLNAPPIG